MALAQHEVKLSRGGLSVLYHERFQFYQFNVMRSKGYIPMKGYSTAGKIVRLFAPPKAKVEMDIPEEKDEDDDDDDDD